MWKIQHSITELTPPRTKKGSAHPRIETQHVKKLWMLSCLTVFYAVLVFVLGNMLTTKTWIYACVVFAVAVACGECMMCTSYPHSIGPSFLQSFLCWRQWWNPVCRLVWQRTRLAGWQVGLASFKATARVGLACMMNGRSSSWNFELSVVQTQFPF